MPVNRNALIRYKTIDKCLQNRYRRWTLDDLMDACGEALYEYEGIDTGVSRRTIQGDIQMMRSDKLGYNAPIIVKEKKYYLYEDPDYSITNIPLTEQDLGKLSEVVEFMKQFQGFSHFRELDGMVQKLEDHIYAQKTKTPSVIDIEKNENLKGLEHLSTLYQAIIKQYSLNIAYQSFKARSPKVYLFHPYLLKEYRNRWFIIGSVDQRSDILFLALDRIVSITRSHIPYRENPDFDATTFFKNAIGVSASPGVKPIEVRLWVSQLHAPYVLTKPFHHSQKLLERTPYGTVISFEVQHNFELEKEILAFGDGVKVISPPNLKRRILQRLENSIDIYKTELSEKGIFAAKQQLQHRGYAIVNHIYSGRDLRKISTILPPPSAATYGLRQLFQSYPELLKLVFNENLKKLVNAIDPKAFVVKSIYFDKPAEANCFVPWHQDIPINVKEKLAQEGFEKWTFKNGINSVWPPIEVNHQTFTVRIHLDKTNELNGALKVLPGSHKKRFTHDEQKLITDNSEAVTCEVEAGGVMLMRPLLLHSSDKSRTQKKRRVIHIEFTSVELDGSLEWLERVGFQ
ncbi:WYL domain-containing protein [bacterium]|nr:WYL domain-containing protein [bacterium]